MPIIGDPILIGGKQETPDVPFDVYSRFTSQGLTSSGWTSDDGTKTVTKAAGAWTVSGNQLIANGSTYFNIAFPKSSATLSGIRCTIDSSFVPVSSGNWYAQSCILGCELTETQQDYGITLVRSNNQIYPCIGYARTSYSLASKPITLGVEHDLFIYYSGIRFYLLMDGEQVATVAYTAGGTSITTMGVFWNKSSGNTAVKGSISEIGVWEFNPAHGLPSFD